jgi:hypothetical protein
MVSTVLLALGASVVWFVYRVVTGLQTNLAAARASGLPYYIAPLNPVKVFSQLTHPVWATLWKCLPRKYWDPIVEVCIPLWQYRVNHHAFEKLGPAFLVVSPFHINLYTDDAEAIHQITSRREAFPKPLENYKILTIFGQNIVTTEGPIWRMHRKITSASFNERNSALVFNVAVEQAQGLVQHWKNNAGTERIETMEADTMALALNIISFVGFGLRLCWPGQSLPAGYDPKLAKYAGLAVPSGHTMSFKDSIASVLHNLFLLLVIPRSLLSESPRPS